MENQKVFDFVSRGRKENGGSAAVYMQTIDWREIHTHASTMCSQPTLAHLYKAALTHTCLSPHFVKISLRVR